MGRVTSSMPTLARAVACAMFVIGAAGAVAADAERRAAFAAPLGLPRLRHAGVPVSGRAGVCRLGMLYDEVVGDYKEGEKVKLKADTWFFHVSPKDHPDGLTIKAGTQGTIKKIILQPDCKSTPHRPIQVAFTEPRKWMAHMEKNELERA
eukprot:Tamp_22089.p1 GENE.Tamp_22089~~Tamp_22089.p1  ORF type:complete len:150 (+),score=32.94 Tamp_22089:65-514(+)